jgi:hypothetical protein
VSPACQNNGITEKNQIVINILRQTNYSSVAGWKNYNNMK